MGVALSVVWAIVGLLWLVTAPGVLVAFAAVGDPPPGFLPGWVIAFLGWLSVPVTVVLALVAIAGDGRSASGRGCRWRRCSSSPPATWSGS